MTYPNTDAEYEEHAWETVSMLTDAVSRASAYIVENALIPEDLPRVPEALDLDIPQVPEDLPRLDPMPEPVTPEPYTPLSEIPGLLGTSDYWREQIAVVQQMPLDLVPEVRAVPDLYTIIGFDRLVDTVLDDKWADANTLAGMQGALNERRWVESSGLRDVAVAEATTTLANRGPDALNDVADALIVAVERKLLGFEVFDFDAISTPKHGAVAYNPAVFKDLNIYA